MREFMEAFRLPGEAQQISRITETFAEVYFASGPGKLCTTRFLKWVTNILYSGGEIPGCYLRPCILNHHVKYRPA